MNAIVKLALATTLLIVLSVQSQASAALYVWDGTTSDWDTQHWYATVTDDGGQYEFEDVYYSTTGSLLDGGVSGNTYGIYSGTVNSANADFNGDILLGVTRDGTAFGTLKFDAYSDRARMKGKLILAGGTLHLATPGAGFSSAGGYLVQNGTTSYIYVDAGAASGLGGGNWSGGGTVVLQGEGAINGGWTAAQWANFTGTLDVRSQLGTGSGGATLARLTADANAKINSGGKVVFHDNDATVMVPVELAGGTLSRSAGGSTRVIRGSITVTADSTIEGNFQLESELSGTGNIVLTNVGNLYMGSTTTGGVTYAFDSSNFTGAINVASDSFVHVNKSSTSGDITLHVGGLAGGGTVQRSQSGTGKVIIQPRSGQSYTFDGVLTATAGTLALEMNGPGTQILNEESTYTGGTTINGGMLVVGDANALGTTGDITLNGGTLAVGSGIEFTRSFTFNGGTLGGNGTFAQDIVVGAGKIVAPGMSVGTLSFNNLVMGNGSIWNFEFGGSDNDQIIVLGTLSIDGGGIFNLYQEGTTAAYTALGEYYLIKYGELYADWDAPNFGLTVSGLSPDDYFFSTDGEWIKLTITGVPEPATMAFLALGGLAMAGGAIRRRRTA